MPSARFVRRAAYVLCIFSTLSSRHLLAQENVSKPILLDRIKVRETHVKPDIGELFKYVQASGPANAELPLTILTYHNTLGVETGEVDAALRTQLEIGEGTGVVVVSVKPESEAPAALLQKHDVVLKINDQPIAGQKQFDELIGKAQGQTLQVYVLRKGKPTTVAVVIPKTPLYRTVVRGPGNLAESKALARWLQHGHTAAEKQYRIGVVLSEADDVLRSQLRLAAGEGLVVTDVVADSPAVKAGIQKNDVLIKLDGKRLNTVESVNSQVQEIKDRSVGITLIRAGAEISLEVTPQVHSSGSVHTALSRALLNKQSLYELKYLEQLSQRLEASESKPQSTAAEQIAALKKQLADLQRAVESLETSLQNNSAEKPVTPPEEKK